MMMDGGSWCQPISPTRIHGCRRPSRRALYEILHTYVRVRTHVVTRSERYEGTLAASLVHVSEKSELGMR